MVAVVAAGDQPVVRLRRLFQAAQDAALAARAGHGALLAQLHQLAGQPLELADALLHMADVFVQQVVDFAAMFHVLSNKYLDAFGNPTTGGVTLAFAAGMTLMWFMFIGILLKVTKIGAFMVWVLLVLFLGVTLWPSEVSSLQSLWGSTQAQIGGFGATSTEAIVTAPLWFLSLGISILAVGYTLPGLVFIYAKSRIARMNELWRLRSEACAVIAQADAVDAEFVGFKGHLLTRARIA